ncbi:MAG TPA: TIGR04255 family protein, partial [Gemmataceae bacterium]|nr:TIGR04255 family protein [Gemmataceae bacterium]
MAFPEHERVVYERNTLEEVSCQVRFPTILSIDAAAPAAFQEAVRAELPLYEAKSSIKLPAGVPAVIAQRVERDLSLVGTKSYAFSTEDRLLTLALSKEGLSLVCRKYERWEPFRKHMQRALASLVSHYNPSFFTHVCVRYKNSIRRKPLGIPEDTPWSKLIQPWVG